LYNQYRSILTNWLNGVVNVTRQWPARRERCMYCGDAHGSDIDHFWPKAPYPERMFRWPNMLLCCAECGRIKGTQFPLADGQAILIDPTVDDPWLFLDFDPQTGNIVPRYDPGREAYILRGEQTVAILQFDRREAMARGYQRSFRFVAPRPFCVSGADPGAAGRR
jgi:uncharacterized protein (TIGR02646 family)